VITRPPPAGRPRGRTDSLKARPRVLFIGTFPPADAGSRTPAEALAGKLRETGFETHLTSKRRSRIGRVVDMLHTTWTARAAYDVAHLDVYSGAAFRWADLISRVLRAIGKPSVLTLHGGNLPHFARRHPRRVARLLARADAVIAPSRYLAAAVHRTRGDVRIIPNAVAIESYRYTARDNPRALLIWLRTFHRIYDPGLAVRVLARVASYVDDAHLTMVGPDKDGTLAAVRAEAERLGVLDRVIFTGGVPKTAVADWLARADIFLNTSTVDNAPVSVLEAMAAGLPVVSTAVGGIPYVLEHENHALLVPPGDAEAMAQAVRRLLVEPGLAGRLSRNARAKAETFAWEAVLPRWQDLLIEIAHGDGARK
jgi:glycosyltransferase involved in cell wall biosynthesis